MARRRKRFLPRPQINASQINPWYKKAWVIISIVAAAAYGVVMHGKEALEHAQELPAAFETTKNKFFVWYYGDAEWHGLWNSFPEGYVDMEDMKLSKTDVNLILQSNGGRLDGVISSKAICGMVPLFDFVLIEGEVNGGGGGAKITAFDFIFGSRRNFGTFKLERDGVVLTMTPLDETKHWFPEPVRIGQHPDISDDKAYESVHGFCKTERGAALERLGIKLK